MKLNVTLDPPEGMRQEEYDGVLSVETGPLGELDIQLAMGTVITLEADEWTAFAVEKENT